MLKEKIIELVSLQCRAMGLPDSQFFKFKNFILAIPGDEIPVADGNIPVLICDNYHLPSANKLQKRFEDVNKSFQMFLDTSKVFDITNIPADEYYLMFDLNFTSIVEVTDEFVTGGIRRGLSFNECINVVYSKNIFNDYGMRGIHASKSRYHSERLPHVMHMYRLGIGPSSYIKVARETESFVDYGWVYPRATIYDTI